MDNETNNEKMPAVIDSFKGDYAYMSNFYAYPVTVGGMTYRNAEAAYQAMKFAGKEEEVKKMQKIFSQLSPGDAKFLGNQIKLKEGWDEGLRDLAMLGVLKAKFSEPKLADLLLSTGDAELIEGNTWHDVHFGRCRCEKHGGQGENMLGKLLMAVRDQLRIEKNTDVE